jgi:signal transduction histidine kinase/CheY-like chemotaxis protein/HPt (histidine-containing phosphotransfer) domain-containing protein
MKIKSLIILVEMTIVLFIMMCSVLTGLYFLKWQSEQNLLENMKTTVHTVRRLAESELEVMRNHTRFTAARFINRHSPDGVFTMTDEDAQLLCDEFGFIGFHLIDESGVRYAYSTLPPDLNADYIRRSFVGEELVSVSMDNPKEQGIIRVSVPVDFVEEATRAVLVTSWFVVRFADIFTEFVLVQKGDIIVVDEWGNILASRDKQWVIRRENFIKKAAEKGYASFADFFKRMLAAPGGDCTFSLQGEKYLAVYSAVGGTPSWKIAVTNRISKMPVEEALRGLLASGFMVLLLGGTAAFIFAGKISKPYEKIREQNEMLAAADKARSEFLASVSHEIRTPMNAIIGMSELMPQHNMTQVQTQYFATIKNMAKSLLQIINDTLDISKIESGKFSLVPGDYDIHVLFDNICSVARFFASTKDLVFRGERDEDVPPFLYGDSIRLEQICTNLINNAIKYTTKGSVRFHLSVERKKEKNYLMIEVEDTGIGIKQENISRLFDSYARFDHERNRGIIGTGLGLTIVRQLTEMMEGFIEVESEYGRGSTFTVHVPLIPGEVVSISAGAGDLRVKPSEQVRALVVDDTPVNRMVAQGFLNLYGLTVETASNGREAIKKLSTPYDIIFMDHMMEGLDGLETTRRIRALGKDTDDYARYMKVPIIALTANTFPENIKMFFDVGMNDFLGKPIENTELKRVLQKWLPPEKITMQEMKKPGDNPADSPEMACLRQIPGLDVEQGILFCGGSYASYRAILKIFCEDLSGDIEALRHAVEVKDWKACTLILHTFKGTLRSIGNEPLGQKAVRLEAAGKIMDEHAISQGVEPFIEELYVFYRQLAPLTEDAQENTPA